MKEIRKMTQEEIDKSDPLTVCKNAEDKLYCYDYHKYYQYENQLELKEKLKERCDRHFKAEKIKSHSHTKKYLSTDGMEEAIRRYYPYILVGTSLEDCKLLFYNFDLEYWSEDHSILKRLIKKMCGNRDLNRNIRDITNGLIFDELSPFKNVSQNKYKGLTDDKQFNLKLNFKNGQFNYITNELKKTMPSDMITYRRPYALPDKVDSKFEKELNDYFEMISEGNEDKKMTFQQVMFVIMAGIRVENKMIMIQGPAGSGKSTYLDIALKLFGFDMNHDISNDRAVKFSLSDFDRDDALARIGLAQILFSSDNNDKITINNIETFKAMLSGELFSYFVKFKERGYNLFQGPIIEVMNDIPSFASGVDRNSITDRIHFLTINQRIRKTSNEIKNYAEHLTSGEKIGQLALYLIKKVKPFNYFKYNENDKLNEQMNDKDIVYQFVEDLENNEILYNQKLPTSILYQAYRDFSKQINPSAAIKSQMTFTKTIESYLEDKDFELIRARKTKSYLEKSFNYTKLEDYYYIYNIDHAPSTFFQQLNNEKFDDEIRLLSQALNYYYYLKNKSTRLEDLKQLSHLRDAYELYQDGEVDHFVNAMEQYRLEEKENDDNAL